MPLSVVAGKIQAVAGSIWISTTDPVNCIFTYTFKYGTGSSWVNAAMEVDAANGNIMVNDGTPFSFTGWISVSADTGRYNVDTNVFTITVACKDPTVSTIAGLT